jgi:hypothetical protein
MIHLADSTTGQVLPLKDNVILPHRGYARGTNLDFHNLRTFFPAPPARSNALSHEKGLAPAKLRDMLMCLTSGFTLARASNQRKQPLR